NGSLDLNVTNAELEVGNPFRGLKKKLTLTYSYDGGDVVTTTKDEREWLIIGQSARYVKGASGPRVEKINSTDDELHKNGEQGVLVDADKQVVKWDDGRVSGPLKGQDKIRPAPLSATALTDHLLRKFSITSHRLRGPMPIEVPTFHRNDLAQLFAELGFNRGVEVGVAEGNYSEVLLKANPNLHLLLVDPWHAYSGNPQNKSKEKNEYAYNETV